MRRVAGDLSVLGGFFELSTHDPATAPERSWREVSELAEPAAFSARGIAVRAALAKTAAVEPAAISARVAVSVTHLGLVARILSPVLAAASLRAVLLSAELAQLRWQPVVGGAVPLSISARSSLEVHETVSAMAGAIETGVLSTSIAALTAAAGQLSVSSAVLWGNVASAINGASSQLEGAAGQCSPRAAGGAAQLPPRELANAVLNGPLLRGRHSGQSAQAFRRRSCCLMWRLSTPTSRQVCADCILAATPSTDHHLSAEPFTVAVDP